MKLASLAFAYALAVFAVGIVLGVVRTVWLAPHIGLFAAVAVELPVMLLVSWAIARRLVDWFAIETAGRAFVSGALALALLLLFECTLTLAMGGSGKDWLSSLVTPAGLLGLLGQGVFAMIPGLMVNSRNRR